MDCWTFHLILRARESFCLQYSKEDGILSPGATSPAHSARVICIRWLIPEQKAPVFSILLAEVTFFSRLTEFEIFDTVAKALTTIMRPLKFEKWLIFLGVVIIFADVHALAARVACPRKNVG